MVAPISNFPDDRGDPDERGDSEESRRPDFEPRDAGRQPACPADLESSPPESDTCGRIREMLRDFADGDLTDVEVAAVESHAHSCRTCALALSRAESERMQITAALAEVDTSTIGPSAGFTEAVMQNVRELAETQPSVGFTTRVMARVRETALAESVLGTEEAPRRRHRMPLYLALAATVMFATWIGLRVFESPVPAVVEVLAAEHAEMQRDGNQISLVATDHWNADEHQAADEFLTGEHGWLELLWKPHGKAIALRADEHTAFRVGTTGRITSGTPGAIPGGSSMSHPDDPPVVALRDGALTVETDAAVELSLGDGSSVGVGRGQYHVTVQRVRHQDSRAGLLVKVHVRDGAARIERGGRTTLVAAGSQALYTTFTPVTLDRASDEDLFLASRRRARDRATQKPAVASRERQFFGQVLDPRTSTPVPGVSISIATYLGDQTVTTNADGMFELTGRRELRGQFVLLRAVPPPKAEGLAPLPIMPVFLDPREESAGGRPRGVRRFFLEPAGVVQGRVQDATRRAPAGLWLQAVAVDELLGSVVPIGARVAGDETGEFAIRGLTTATKSHRRMLIVAGAAAMRPRVVWARAAVRVEDAALDIALPVVGATPVGGFAPGEVVHLLLAVGGIPAGSGVWPTTARADAAGRLHLDLAAPVFVLSATQAPRMLAGEASARLEVDVPALRGLRIGSLATDKMHWFRRDTLPDVAQLEADGGFVSVHEDSSGQACPGALVFRRAADGSITFLGVYDGHVPLPCASGTAGRLLVRAPEGWVGRFDLDRPLGRAHLKSMAVHRPGHVDWQGTAKGVVVLYRSRAGGLPIPVARQGDESRWDLPAGEYRFGSQTLRVDSDATVTLR
jgi:Putative zinc-finger